MARPPDADSAETYERIVAAALAEVRTTQPRNGVSMRKVAERAEVSLGTLQYYFDNKEGLLEACLDAYHDRLASLGRAQIASADPDGDVATTIENGVRTFIRFIREEQALVELRMVTNALRGELHPRRQEPFMGQIIRLAAATLAPRLPLTELELRVAIQGLVAMLVRLALLSEGEQESLTDETGAAAEQVVEDVSVAAALRLLHPEHARPPD